MEEDDASALTFARSYQLEALSMAIEQNTISYLETGSGKTLIAVMLLRHFAFRLRKPSPFVAVFLVPQVVLVRQQAAVVQTHTDLKVGMYWGEMGVDFWDGVIWKQETEKHEVLVMTPQILLNSLRHGFLKLEFIKVLIFDECHHTSGNHPYACIMKEFYHPMMTANTCDVPRIFGMTASLIKSKCTVSEIDYWDKIRKLETMMHSKIGALTDNLVPDTVAEKMVDRELGEESKDDDHRAYFPPDFVRDRQLGSNSYYCYLIQLIPQFDSEIPFHDIVLVICNELETDVISSNFTLETDRGTVAVKLSYIGNMDLRPMMVNVCRRFQMTILDVLINHSLEKLSGNFEESKQNNHLDYFLLPAVASAPKPIIDWKCVSSVLFDYNQAWGDRQECKFHGNTRAIETKDGPVCKCMLENSLIYTPHNGRFYCVLGVSNELTANSLLSIRVGESVTYKDYYKMRHGLGLRCEEQSLLRARQIFPVLNLLHRCKQQRKEKESGNAYVDLPPELCRIIMSPISISTFYSFTFVPSVMHRLESLLIASTLKKMHLDNVAIPSEKILEAITTKTCQEKIHLESLETLGDSFLKYAACQHLFKAHQNNHEGLLSIKKDRIVSNASLFSVGSRIKLPGFIRDAAFDPKTWMIPGSNTEDDSLTEELLPNSKKIFVCKTRTMKRKKVADVVEALIGAYLSSAGETAALLFMNSIGITVDFDTSPLERHFQLNPEKLINVSRLESVLNYTFNDPSLLVEALTHGSYMLPEIPRCYQRLEFLGDSVLDYLITVHIYKKHPNISPGLLTDMRSASVNNDCYARSALKNELHKHILHASTKLHSDISRCIADSKYGASDTTFGWESDTSYPKVLGDIMESLAGAILVDSDYNKDVVCQSMMPLLEPLVTPETLRLEPVRELGELCQREQLVQSKPVVVRGDGFTLVTVQVEASSTGVVFSNTSSAADKKTAKRIASKEILKALRKSGVLTS
ncbi:Endoribonuclease Dicer homolog 2 [Linum grandiflorum]